MACAVGPERSGQLFAHRKVWSHWAIAWSATMHGLLFALAGWASGGGYQRPSPIASERVTRAFTIYYLDLTPKPTKTDPHPRPRPARRPAPEPAAPAPATPQTMPIVAEVEPRDEPRASAIQVEELAPGTIEGIGSVIAAPGSDGPAGRGLSGELGLRAPSPGEAAPGPRGPSRVAELVSAVGSACPQLRRPADWANREVAVSVAFVVDTNGRVDPETLRVIESPIRPQTDNRFHAHIYIVGATAREDRGRLDPATYDSLITHEVASHVAHLMFRPALSEGQAIRSTVLVSCQTS
jgi:hypothetical protein